MADGILNLCGALGLVGSGLAVALIILWLTIGTVSSSERAEDQSHREEPGAPEDTSGEVSASTDDDRALEAEVAKALEPSRP